MRGRRLCALLCAVALALPPLTALATDAVTPREAEAIITAQQRDERALLIGVDYFVSKPNSYPSSTNNVNAMWQVFQGARKPFEAIVIPSRPVTSVEALTGLIQATFGGATNNDVSYLYLSTHGVYNPGGGEPPTLLLSDGRAEEGITPAQLEAAFEGVAGTKVLILDACNSGAFIGKGMAQPPERVYFSGSDFKVLTSSGALEESWYWSASDEQDGRKSQGSFYFTQAITQGLSAGSGYPADQNRDGCVTLNELYEYLLLNHAASTPQVYPQVDGFEVFRYDVSASAPTGPARSPVVDVTFSGTMLSRSSRQITIEFIATRPVRVAYQIVYQRDGRWDFANAQLIYDAAERFTAYGDRAGAVSAGRKVRSLTIGELPGESYGYVLVQLVSLDDGTLTVHAGRVLSVPPAADAMRMAVRVDESFAPGEGREMRVFVAHEYPCALSVAVVDEEERVIHRLCHRQSTRPTQMEPEGSVFYWDGTLRDGATVDAGKYRVRAQAVLNGTTITVFSSAFTIH